MAGLWSATGSVTAGPTNQYEQRVYQVLKQRQAALTDFETIGIMPLGGMRVGKRVLEPDFLITYRGRAAVIEVDGPHHRDAPPLTTVVTVNSCTLGWASPTG